MWIDWMSPFVISIAIAALTSIAWAAWSMAPWVPTWRSDLERIFKLAELQPGEIFYDFGCGNGKVVLAAAKRGAKAYGIELGLPLYVWCVVAKWFKRSSAKFFWGNAFHYNLSQVDVLYVFGMPQALQHKLAKKLNTELKPGARVVSYAFPITGLPNEIKNKPNPKQLALYVYHF